MTANWVNDEQVCNCAKSVSERLTKGKERERERERERKKEREREREKEREREREGEREGGVCEGERGRSV